MRTVVYAGTRNVYKDMVTACKSLLYHHAADRVVFLIEDDTFPEELPSCVECRNVSDQTFFPLDNPNCLKRWTYMSLMRCALPLMGFSGRLLWLDIDTIVLNDLSGLWGLPEAPVWMVQELRKEDYYNAGVLLMDCDLIREDSKKMVELLNTEEHEFTDQDVICKVMKGRISKMPPEYNASQWTVKGRDGTKIIHFAAAHNKHRDQRWRRFEKMEWGEIV